MRRGYFVEGLGAAQFATAPAPSTGCAPAPAATGRRTGDGPPGAPALVLAATDPANAYGAALPWPARPRRRGQPGTSRAARPARWSCWSTASWSSTSSGAARPCCPGPTTRRLLQSAADALALAVREGALGRSRSRRPTAARSSVPTTPSRRPWRQPASTPRRAACDCGGDPTCLRATPSGAPPSGCTRPWPAQPLTGATCAGPDWPHRPPRRHHARGGQPGQAHPPAARLRPDAALAPAHGGQWRVERLPAAAGTPARQPPDPGGGRHESVDRPGPAAGRCWTWFRRPRRALWWAISAPTCSARTGTAERQAPTCVGSAATIGAALLDQRNLAGVGTLWASESLFLERIHPWAPADSLDPGVVSALVTARAPALDAARQHAVQSTTGSRRARARPPRCTRRSGRPCRRCGEGVRVAMIGEAPQERTMFYCPHCQGGLAPTDDGRAQRPLGSGARGSATGYRRG